MTQEKQVWIQEKCDCFSIMRVPEAQGSRVFRDLLPLKVPFQVTLTSINFSTLTVNQGIFFFCAGETQFMYTTNQLKIIIEIFKYR